MDKNGSGKRDFMNTLSEETKSLSSQIHIRYTTLWSSYSDAVKPVTWLFGRNMNEGIFNDSGPEESED